MFRVLEGELEIGLVFYGLFAIKNHYGSRQRRFFRKIGTLAPALTVHFLSFLARFQAVTLEHFGSREVKYDPFMVRIY